MYISSAILPGINQLAFDYTQQYSKVSEFFTADYHAPSSYPRIADNVARARHADRAKLIPQLEAGNKKIGAGEKTFEHLALLSQPECLAVVTGQQAGLFGGPLYTLYKALTACRLAQHLTNFLSRPVVPVFYLVSEDHDFEEIRWAGFFDQHQQWRKVIYGHPVATNRSPIANILLDPAIETAIAAIEVETPPTEFKQEILLALRHDYSPGTGFAMAFSTWFVRLLKEWGMIFCDPTLGGLKELAKPVWQQELVHDLSIKTITATNERLQANGYEPQLSVHPDRPNLFILKNGRHSLQRQKSGFLNMGDQSIVTAETLLSQPENLSPKAALRPLFQDYLFPTIAYVAGPGEIAYWAQLKKTYEAFSIPMPIVVPRAAFTLLEPRIKKHLDRFGLTVNDVLSNSPAILERLRHQALPQEIDRALSAVKTAMNREWLALKKLALDADPALKSPADKSEHTIQNSLLQFENKILATLEQKQTVATSQYKNIEQAILPGGHLQERQMSLLPFLFKYHWAFTRTIADAIDIHRLEHQVITL